MVVEYLAEGGMGAIYLGKKLGAGGFEKQVVLKQLLPEFTRQPEFIDLFLREARLSATLDHANIIHTIDLVTAGEEHFIVMEYLDGADLRTLLKKSKRKRRRISAAAGIYVAKELLSALAYAHNKNDTDGNHLRLIHRDISPSNILISGNGEVKLTDFGIAKAATHNSVFYRVKGKIGYMSPEQARSEPMDARSDLYSMAVCLYEMLTGERLLVSAGITTSADELYSKPVPLVSQKVEGLPAELDKVMLRALSVDPNHRYQTAAELQEALLRCAHRHHLMMSAPELAGHLRDVCGAHSGWRNEETKETEIGTEVAEGTQQITNFSLSEVVNMGNEEEDVVALGEVAQGPTKTSHMVRAHTRQATKTSLTLLEDLQGVELTSMSALGESGDGAKPLVDLNSFGSFGSPRVPTNRTPSPDRASSDMYTGVVIVKGDQPQPAPAPQPLPHVSAARESAPLALSPSARAEDLVPEPTRRPWLLFCLILMLGVGTAAVVGLTGPKLEIDLD